MEQFKVTGMSCAACAARVEKAVSALKGVTECSVSLLTNSMNVSGTASKADIIAAVQKAGYGAEPLHSEIPATENAQNEERLEKAEIKSLKIKLMLSLVFWAALMYVSMGHTMWSFPVPAFLRGNHIAIGITELLLAVIIAVINQRFFINGFKGLIHKAPNMDTLVALGAAAAFIYSTVALFAMTVADMRSDTDAVMKYMHEFYFESAGTILTLITVGKTLEARSKGKTTDALKGLMKLAPKTAVVLRDDEELTVTVDKVSAGDVFLVRPGDSIPVDGTVIGGSAAVDEASLTGESIPVDKESGDDVFAGTFNRSGFLKCKATRVGEDTALSQIIRMVSDASATKAPIAKIADKVSGIFVPVVITLAVITVAIWLVLGQSAGFALARGISVLVISCPCALGLATPVAIMVGSGIGAKNGILFKTAVSLEMTGRANIAALDKTGTITLGEPSVTDIIPIAPYSEKELLSAAFSLEKNSEHPLAKAIVNEAVSKGYTAVDTEYFTALPGNGVKAVIGGKSMCAGSLRFISSQTEIGEQIKSSCEELSGQGKTLMLFTCDGKLCGVIAVADKIKADSALAVKELKGMGIYTVMLTGDNAPAANAIGSLVGVDEVISELLPGEKENAIRELQKKGTVLMVGDGINDAPALTAADIGIAVGTGADIAADAADVVVMKSRFSDVAAAVRLSRATLKNIRENLFWAFIYNTVGIPLAAGLFIGLLGWKLNPMFAAAAMSLSSVSVVTNALRLNLFKLYDNKNKSNIRKERNKMEKTLKIEGMMCGHCEMHTKKALESLDGVQQAQVSHKTGTAAVTLSHEVDNSVLKRAVEEQGYTVTAIE